MNEDLLNNPENPCNNSTFGGGATLSSNRKGFTLAETIIVVVILGLVATLTVPNLINKQKETTQRTKIKKAMAMYESVVNKMILENDRSFNGLNAAGCDKTVSYFKYIKRDTNNGCIFQTSDKIWWDLTDIQRPLIAFEKNNLTVQTANAADNKDAFVMVGRYDDQGILRVDDLGFESIKGNSIKDSYGYESKAQLEKLYGFINNKKFCAAYDYVCRFRSGASFDDFVSELDECRQITDMKPGGLGLHYIPKHNESDEYCIVDYGDNGAIKEYGIFRTYSKEYSYFDVGYYKNPDGSRSDNLMYEVAYPGGDSYMEIQYDEDGNKSYSIYYADTDEECYSDFGEEPTGNGCARYFNSL